MVNKARMEKLIGKIATLVSSLGLKSTKERNNSLCTVSPLRDFDSAYATTHSHQKNRKEKNAYASFRLIPDTLVTSFLNKLKSASWWI